VDDTCRTGTSTDSGIFDAHVAIAVAVCSNEGCWRRHVLLEVGGRIWNSRQGCSEECLRGRAGMRGYC
jgi:hypothetical protein